MFLYTLVELCCQDLRFSKRVSAHFPVVVCSPAMDLSKYRHTDRVVVDAPPEAVYALIADVTRIGEFSPVCKSAEWLDGDHATFSGTNVLPERQWTTMCRIDVAEPSHEFTFTNLGSKGKWELVRWSYTLDHADGATTVNEYWEVLPGYADFWDNLGSDQALEDYLDSVVDPTHAGMAETLANIKATAEE